MTLEQARKSLLPTTSLYPSSRFDWVEGSGKDCLSFLHRVTTGDIAGVGPGGGTTTLLLDPKSRVLFVARAFVGSETVRLLVPAGQGPDFARGLAKFAIMDDCAFAPLPARGLLALLGPASVPAMAAAGFPSLDDLLAAPPWSHRELVHPSLGPVWVAHAAELGCPGLWISAPEAPLAALAATLGRQGCPTLEPQTVERLRILAMEPQVGSEILPDRFPVEIGLGRAIYHAKGCYVGQETIVRMRDRGNCRRRLVRLHLDSTDTPATGDILDAPNRPTAGQITSAAVLPDGTSTALALLSTTIAVGTPVQVHHDGRLVSATVVEESKPFE
jgi:folate-binding protein YgfZ